MSVSVQRHEQHYFTFQMEAQRSDAHSTRVKEGIKGWITIDGETIGAGTLVMP